MNRDARYTHMHALQVDWAGERKQVTVHMCMHRVPQTHAGMKTRMLPVRARMHVLFGSSEAVGSQTGTFAAAHNWPGERRVALPQGPWPQRAPRNAWMHTSLCFCRGARE